MYSTPIEITINPIIRESAFIPDAPNALVMILELMRNMNVMMQTLTIEVRRMS